MYAILNCILKESKSLCTIFLTFVQKVYFCNSVLIATYFSDCIASHEALFFTNPFVLDTYQIYAGHRWYRRIH